MTHISLAGQRPNQRNQGGTHGGWNRRTTGEPQLSELLDDPVLHLMMHSDAVSQDSLLRLIQQVQTSAARGLCLSLAA